MSKYDVIIIDTVNLAYKLFNKTEEPLLLSKKFIYKDFICNFIKSVESLESQYLHFDGEVYLLIDNYFSRADLESAFLSLNRKQIDETYKATRKKENREFYNSINFIRYYYIINSSKYHTIRIDGLEADDLVKPLVQNVLKDKSCLLITSDLDWCRYLSEKTDWLPSLKEEPETLELLKQRLQFPVTEVNLICYKALFGDKSDNVTAMLPENEENKKLFLDLIKVVTYPEQIIYMSRDEAFIERYPILKCIKANDCKKIPGEKRYLSNVQLVSTLSCSLEHLRKNTTTGTDNKTLIKAVREAIGLDTPKGVFVFGGVRRPRV